VACTNIITEDGRLIITESGIELVTEDSVCPPPPGGGDEMDKLYVGTAFSLWVEVEPHIGGG